MFERVVTQTRRSGFALILVILLMSLFGVALFVLASTSRTMMFETTRATLEADSANLAASGRAWAQHNKEELRKHKNGHAIGLNVDDLVMREALCTILVDEVRAEDVSVTISTSCTRGRQKLERSIELDAGGCICEGANTEGK
jgi:hypothetical protein